MASRIAALLALLLVLGLAPGCFVFEELDAGQETMDRLSQESSGSEEGSGAGSGDADGEGKDETDPDGWWKKARTLTPGGGSDESAEEGGASKSSAAVPCHLDGGTRFMRRDECLGRGGTPAG